MRVLMSIFENVFIIFFIVTGRTIYVSKGDSYARHMIILK